MPQHHREGGLRTLYKYNKPSLNLDRPQDTTQLTRHRGGDYHGGGGWWGTWWMLAYIDPKMVLSLSIWGPQSPGEVQGSGEKD